MKIEDYDAVYSLCRSCTGMGLNKLDDFKKEVVFERNETGNEFWESQGFTVDLVYRNKSVADIVRIDT